MSKYPIEHAGGNFYDSGQEITCEKTKSGKQMWFFKNT